MSTLTVDRCCEQGKIPTTVNTGETAELNHCDKTEVGGAVQTIANAMPVRPDLEAAMSYLIARSVTNNECPCKRWLSMTCRFLRTD